VVGAVNGPLRADRLGLIGFTPSVGDVLALAVVGSLVGACLASDVAVEGCAVGGEVDVWNVTYASTIGAIGWSMQRHARTSLMRFSEARQRGDHLGWRLDQLDQDALATKRKVVARLGVDEAHVMTRSALSYTSRSEPHALVFEPIDGGGKVVDPQADVVERGSVDPRSPLRVERLHQVDLHRVSTVAQRQDVFSDVLRFGCHRLLGAYQGSYERSRSRQLGKELTMMRPDTHTLGIRHYVAAFMLQCSRYL